VHLPGFSLFFFPFAIRTQLRLHVQLGGGHFCPLLSFMKFRYGCNPSAQLSASSLSNSLHLDTD
jgi:hypothetical protein